MRNRNHYFEGWFQIFILVVSTIAFSYILHEGYKTEEIILKEENEESVSESLLFLLKIANNILWNEKTFVSAQNVISTCMNSKDGRICAEYPSNTCDLNCNENCIPVMAKDIEACRVGTCYDSVEGTCAVGSLRQTCESGGGTWLDDPNGNVPQCKKGCCLIGSGAKFSTEGECQRTSDILGIAKNFKPEINTEAQCLLGAGAEKEGACVLGKDISTQKNLCKFTTKNGCNLLRGGFYEDVLCSNPELDTNCERQKKTECIENKAEIYWMDSCGNRENIYSADKTSSWNNGRVLSKQESCFLGSALENQRTCGNCNYLAGSSCGEKTARERLDDSLQNVVCRDLSCDTDGDGTKDRKHGESWCEYQSAIGVDEDKERSIDTPGSRHFKKVCAYGDVRLEPCADYRNEICVENKATSGGKSFSSAACRINRWQECISYNVEDNKKEALEKCSKNPDCFVKEVNVAKNFNFKTCAPKYPPGFDLRENDEAAGAICALGTQKCTVVYSKKFKWKCVANCNCLKAGFAQEMNDLCMSLGDCGAEVNYEGELTTGGYKVSGSPKLSSSYFNSIREYSNVIPGQFAEVGDIKKFIGSLGIPNEGANVLADIEDPTSGGFLEGAAAISGVLGIGVFAANALGLIEFTTPIAFPSFFVKALELPSTIPTMMAAVGVVAGALVGFAATFYAIKLLGLGPGLSPAVMYGLMLAGAGAGALIAYSTILPDTVVGAVIPVIGWALLVLVVVAIVFLKITGFGKTKEKQVKFECLPWQQPQGGSSCDRCGKDGFPCSTYSCQSLGATCKLINEGTSEQRCIASDPNDIAAPLISPWDEILTSEYTFANPTELGVQLRSRTGDGCIGDYTSIRMGIELNKPGRCRYSSTPLSSGSAGTEIFYGEEDELTDEQLAESLYGDAEALFSAGVIKEKHSAIIAIPSAEILGLPDYDPDKRADYNIYMRCENANGYESDRDYVMNFCVKPGKDITPPLITIAEPAKGFVRYDTTEQPLKLFTNEPANCAWSLTDKDYTLMENQMTCANNLEDQKLLGWECNSTLPITKNESTFYIRCEDSVWQNDTAMRNRNAESTLLTLKKTQKLEIFSASPDNQTLVFGTPVASIKIEARTRGGMTDYGATCFASFDGQNYLAILDRNSDGTVHDLIMQSFTPGNKKVWLRCSDEIGNTAYRNLSFSVAMDNSAPAITRIYYSSGRLVVKTNEPASCALSEEKCSFDFESGTLMSGSDFEHTSSIKLNTRYYIRCKDVFGNSMGSCDATVKVI